MGKCYNSWQQDQNTWMFFMQVYIIPHIIKFWDVVSTNYGDTCVLVEQEEPFCIWDKSLQEWDGWIWKMTYWMSPSTEMIINVYVPKNYNKLLMLS